MTLPQDTIPPELERMRSEMGAAVRAHWKAFLIEGILLAVLGQFFVDPRSLAPWRARHA